MEIVLYFFKRITHACAGIIYALATERSYQGQVALGVVVLGAFCYFMWPLSKLELLFIGLGWALILITELQNSSFETALDHLHPDLHEKVGRSKDMAAGAVLTAGIFLLFVLVVIALY